MSCNNKILSLKHLTVEDYGKIPQKPNENYRKLVAPHLESYNFFLREGLDLIAKHHKKVYLQLSNSSILCIYIKEIYLEAPTLSIKNLSCSKVIYPKECVERGETYKGHLTATIAWSIDGTELGCINKSFGEAPIMVQSDLCHLRLKNLTPKQLVEKGELPNEAGGYFIINGKKRVMRMLIVNRRHYPFAMVRDSWKKLDHGMTNQGVMMRCSTEDECVSVNVLHYMQSGHIKLTCQVGDGLIPLILCMKALVDFSDYRMTKCILRGREHDQSIIQPVQRMLRDNFENKIYNQEAAKIEIGSALKHFLHYRHPTCSDIETGDLILSNHVLPHLKDYEDKFHMLCFMTRKLFTFVNGDCFGESVDDTSMQEVWLGGFTCLHFVKDKFEDYLDKVKRKVSFNMRKHGPGFNVDNELMKKSTVTFFFDLGQQFKVLISTGTMRTKNSYGVPQNLGLTVVVEHLNKLRDMSHFRSIHRGKFFVEMKSMEPRKFTGEAWGFLCPIHTPDGAPCGLLNHLSHDCHITTNRSSTKDIRKYLITFGMEPINYRLLFSRPHQVEVILDGGIVGILEGDLIDNFVEQLKILRMSGKINKYSEIVNTKQFEFGGKYPAIYIFSSPGRFSRPAVHSTLNASDFIGSFEQLYINIASNYEEIEQGVHTYYEQNNIAMFSNVGKFVPFVDHNPSPRNLYQCQMAKQTIGMPVHNWMTQTENKLYRLQYPQVPLVRNKHYDDMNMEEFAMGTNACVAIISYSGCDMEDAMVINKASLERGFAKAVVYKSDFIDLAEEAKRSGAQSVIFKRDPNRKDLAQYLCSDGLPYPQQKLRKYDPYYCTYNETRDSYFVKKYGGENCTVDKVSIMSASVGSKFRKASITLRIQRTPTIGDKFASRSGQKGIMSKSFPCEDMPFSDRGIVPDILFNPHGIPSRMTGGTLLEVIAGKAAAEHGMSFNSTPFLFNDENNAYEYYGEILEAAGFDYFGEDTLYNGYSGHAIECHIFTGIIYYQRLRHMVEDKWQVRAKGPINLLTRQPIKGRNKGGAIRFGEMERDCLISHGAAYLLQDRLMTCSDTSDHFICTKCGDLLSTSPYIGEAAKQLFTQRAFCRRCGKKEKVKKVRLPYAFKVLTTELASMNIQVEMGFDNDPMNIGSSVLH